MLASPAGRFLDFVLNARILAKGRKGIEGWPLALNAELNSPEFWHRFGLVIQLPSLIERRLRSLPDIDDHDTYLSWIPDVRDHWLACSFQSNMDHWLQCVDRKAESLIRICHDQICRLHAERVIDFAELKELEVSILRVREEILTADLPVHLQEFLLKHCHIMLSAIADYPYAGYERLSAAVEHSYGVCCTDFQTYQQGKNVPLATQVFTLLDRFNTLTKTFEGLQRLADFAVKLILPDR